MVKYARNVFFLVAVYSISGVTIYHNLFTHSIVGDIAVTSSCETILKEASMNILTDVFWYTYE